MTSLVVRVCLDWLEVVSFSWLSRNDQPALTLLIVLLFAAKARKMRNPEKNIELTNNQSKMCNVPFFSLTLAIGFTNSAPFPTLNLHRSLESGLRSPEKRGEKEENRGEGGSKGGARTPS